MIRGVSGSELDSCRGGRRDRVSGGDGSRHVGDGIGDVRYMVDSALSSRDGGLGFGAGSDRGGRVVLNSAFALAQAAWWATGSVCAGGP